MISWLLKTTMKVLVLMGLELCRERQTQLLVPIAMDYCPALDGSVLGEGKRMHGLIDRRAKLRRRELLKNSSEGSI